MKLESTLPERPRVRIYTPRESLFEISLSAITIAWLRCVPVTDALI